MLTMGMQPTASRAWAMAVWIAAGAYAALLSAESISDHNAFETAFDTAIYDQLLWLLAHGQDPFSTVVSRPMMGDHFQPGLVLLTPLYWLGLGVPGILVAQSIGLALTAPALFALARASGASPALASLPPFLWLVSPWVASVNLFEFRPSSFVPALLVVSALVGIQGRYVLLALTSILALSLKEDVSFTYLMLGVLLAYHGRRRPGAVLAAGSALWFVLASLTIESLGGSYGAFGQRFAGERGDSVTEALVWALTHPVQTVADIASQNLAALDVLFLSTGGLALLAPSWMLLSAPTALHNALSAYDPQHSLVYHYHLLTLTGFFVAAAVGVGRAASLGKAGRLAVTPLVVTAIAVAVVGGIEIRESEKPSTRLERSATQRAIERIPSDAVVASAPRLLPHLSQRSEIYMFPEPFVPLDWGSPLTAEDMAERAQRVQFVAHVAGDQMRQFWEGEVSDVRDSLLREGFVVVDRTGPVEILERR